MLLWGAFAVLTGLLESPYVSCGRRFFKSRFEANIEGLSFVRPSSCWP